MKRSNLVTITLLAAAAALNMAGCEDSPRGQVQRCVDQNGQVVTDNNCDKPQPYVGHGAYPYYRWYYRGRGYYVGERATEGSFEPAPGIPAFRAGSSEGTAIVRGGFGGGFHGSFGE